MSLRFSQQVPDGTYRIKSALEGPERFLEYQEDGQWDVRPMPSNPASDLQKWIVAGSTTDLNTYTITNVASSLYLSFAESTDRDGKAIWRLKAFTDGSKWTIEPRAGDQFVIGFVDNEQCVDYANGGGEDWGLVWSRNNRPNQRWILEPLAPTNIIVTPTRSELDGAIVTITNIGSKTVLDLAYGSPEPATAIQGHAPHGGTNQQWKLIQVGGDANKGEWVIMNVQSGTYIDLLDGSAASGTKIVGWAGSGDASNPHQVWAFVPAGADKDVFGIQNVQTGTYIDLYLGGSADGTAVNGWSGPDLAAGVAFNTHQSWKITRV